MITWILLGGALSGAGVLLLVLVFAPPAVQPAAALAELDARRNEGRMRQDVRRLNPDGDDVLLRWWAYPEAGPAPCPLVPRLEDDGAGTVVVTVPARAEAGRQIHLVVEGTDTGSPALTRYQRVVLTVV